MRIWTVLGLCWVVILLIGTQGLVGWREAAEAEARAKDAARRVVAAELMRLGSHRPEQLRADSVERPRLVYGVPLRLVVVTGVVEHRMAPVRLRVLSAAGVPIHEVESVVPLAGPVARAGLARGERAGVAR